MKTTLSVLILCISIICFSQNKKLKFHRFSLSFPVISTNTENGNRSLAISIDTELKYKNHLFKSFLQAGAELNISVFGPSREVSFLETDIMYGRQLYLNNWLDISGFLGLGAFFESSSIPVRSTTSNSTSGVGWPGILDFSSITYTYSNNKETTIGFPLQIITRIKTYKKFFIGIQLHSNFNSISSIFGFGINLSWKFEK